MKKSFLTLYLEIDTLNFNFYVGESDEQNNFKIIYKFHTPSIGIENNRISDFDIVFNTIKEIIYSIEQNLNHTFKEVVLILENFNPKFINLSGYKKLNGSQILRENIIYILNNLKSYIDKFESEKTVLHIFNSKFNLDNKKMDNLPIGLFGDFYFHELSFVLVNKNDYKNINKIFEKCNLKIKKILLKSFIEGANISDDNLNLDTFFKIKIGDSNSKIFYFENNSLKFEQEFKFGNNIIVKDISKITSIKKDIVEKILNEVELNEGLLDNMILEKNYFNEGGFRKIKKKLIYEIAVARIKEISDLILFKNNNLNHYNKFLMRIYLEINHNYQFRSLNEIYKTVFTKNDNVDIKFLEKKSPENLIITANKLVHFGWKKEAIPVAKSKKTLIARFFDTFFG